jgi:hypothetical protein
MPMAYMTLSAGKSCCAPFLTQSAPRGDISIAFTENSTMSYFFIFTETPFISGSCRHR